MITKKNKDEIELMRHAGFLVSLTHQYLKPFIKEGITTKELDKLAYDFIVEHDGVPSCLGYEGYPATLCVSINDTVVHGIPDDTKLKNGDIVTIDIVIGYKGYNGDAAWTYAVGDVVHRRKRLMEYTEQALYEGLKKVKPGNHIGDISHAIEVYAKEHGLGVVHELCGHGIGKGIHEDPYIPNYGKKGKGPLLEPGMVICIEPMLTSGERYIYMLDDDWTIKTDDGSDAAHYEHTVLVTEDGYEVFTPRLEDK